LYVFASTFLELRSWKPQKLEVALIFVVAPLLHATGAAVITFESGDTKQIDPSKMSNCFTMVRTSIE